MRPSSATHREGATVLGALLTRPYRNNVRTASTHRARHAVRSRRRSTTSPRSVTALLAVTALVVLSSASGATALGKVKCDVGIPTGADVAVAAGRAVDPIVYHRVNPADSRIAQPHRHDFFGNRAVPSLAPGGTFSQATGGTTSCRMSADTAAYWAPSLVYTSGPKTGQRVPVRQFTAYYRGFAGQTTHAGSVALPPDVRLVATDMVGYGLSGWTCGAMSSVTGGRDAIPDCSGEDGTAGNTLTAHVNFPSCWNGNAPGHPQTAALDTEYGDTRDNADFTYPTNKTACPATHPIEVVQLRETIQYVYTGNGSDVALTSDAHAMPGMPDMAVMPGMAGTSFHVDFWNTWQPGALKDYVARCVQTAAEADCEP